MKKTDKNSVGKMALDEITNIVPAIYSNKDIYRSVWDIWLHATHHAAAIGEEVRKYKPGQKLLNEIADFAMWLFTFTEKIRGPFEDLKEEYLKENNIRIGEFTIRTERIFSDIIWNKYPGVCPICFWRRVNNGIKSSAEIEKPCDCLIHDVENRDKADTEEEKKKKEKNNQERVKALRKYARSRLENKPATIDGWQEMWRKLYEANLRQISLVDIGFHLLEELGEVSDAMLRMYSYTETFDGQPRWNQIWLEEEVADVFSWLLTLVNSLQIIPDITEQFLEHLGVSDILKLHEHKIMLSRIIWHRYGSTEHEDFRCQACNELPCECKLLLVGENIEYNEFLKGVDYNPLA